MNSNIFDHSQNETGHFKTPEKEEIQLIKKTISSLKRYKTGKTNYNDYRALRAYPSRPNPKKFDCIRT